MSKSAQDSWKQNVHTCREVMKDDVIPYAIKWFTGEAQMEDSDEEYGDEDEEDEEVLHYTEQRLFSMTCVQYMPVI